MALVSLGAAAFTICSMYGFGGRGDPSRMASNVASGVGFIGAGVITTQAYASSGSSSSGGDHRNGETQQPMLPARAGAGVVSGLTTAAAIWLSAAVGVASGVGLYQVAGVTAALTIGTLRFGRDKRRRIKNRIHRSRGTSELHDMSTWDEDVDTSHETNMKVRKKRGTSIIRISRNLPSNAAKSDSQVPTTTNETSVVLEEAPEDNLLVEVMKKKKDRSSSDDDVQPLP